MGEPYFFALGPGWLSRRVARAARDAGGVLVNHQDPGCGCGHGCVDGCPAKRRHWFQVVSAWSRGGDAERVLAAVRAVATDADRKLMESRGEP